MFHDNLHEEGLWSRIAVMIAASKVPAKQVNDVRVIGAGYFFTVHACTKIINKYELIHILTN